ncbi:hypothetical protein COZ81_01010 [Candidatus Jorgensenbacteria bacterium CG_4_8_14_3_um_filter_38_10]|nr:MAG: hypothetical protein COS46_01640 [Candidatus Jorgensenbacteria bacterium CG03_land_8_20_14_0_80_38_39]PIW97722.1 MAG: hypothetical protein COZ81_01010 [Candidatus Jorgensenbacteria bacterium CG_4_8_14_3_um_filter_38_10]PJA95236.1 MAG: hypothetical protein CO130_00205 [Candidatus Jorgensenbacteria bacterium CG_4_9_14_3_um_filter_38_10]
MKLISSIVFNNNRFLPIFEVSFLISAQGESLSFIEKLKSLEKISQPISKFLVTFLATAINVTNKKNHVFCDRCKDD